MGARLPPCSDAEDLKCEAQMPTLDGFVSADATDHEFAKKVPVLHIFPPAFLSLHCFRSSPSESHW